MESCYNSTQLEKKMMEENVYNSTQPENKKKLLKECSYNSTELLMSTKPEEETMEQNSLITGRCTDYLHRHIWIFLFLCAALWGFVMTGIVLWQWKATPFLHLSHEVPMSSSSHFDVTTTRSLNLCSETPVASVTVFNVTSNKVKSMFLQRIDRLGSEVACQTHKVFLKAEEVFGEEVIRGKLHYPTSFAVQQCLPCYSVCPKYPQRCLPVAQRNKELYIEVQQSKVYSSPLYLKATVKEDVECECVPVKDNLT